MAQLIPIDGAVGEGGGQIVRTALALSCATGQGFTLSHIRAGRLRPGLRPEHLAAVRAATMICDARVGGAFEGSAEMRFEPGPVTAGDFSFEIGSARAVTLVLQTVLVPLATAEGPSRIQVIGGTHVPGSPSFHNLASHWAALVAPMGLRFEAALLKAGFYPKGGGKAEVHVTPWLLAQEASLQLEARGRLIELKGLSAAARLRGDIAARQRDAAAHLLWESRRVEVKWETVDLPSGSPGAFLIIEAVFERGRGAVDQLGERGVPPETVGERAARRLLRFLESEGAVDAHAADQLVLPLSVSRGGGRVSTCEVTPHLETAVAVAAQFGVPARVTGPRGGTGLLEVAAH